MTYNINAMGISVETQNMKNLVLSQHTIPYIHVVRTVPIYKNFICMAFCINMVYFTPMVHILHLPKCRPYDGGIKLLNLF